MLDNQIALPEGLMEFVQDRVAQGGYESVSAYLAQLVADDRREQARKELEESLIQGIESGPATEMTPDDWRQIREEVERRLTVSAEASEERFTADPALEALLLERHRSDQKVEVNAEDWAAMRRELAQRLSAKQGTST